MAMQHKPDTGGRGIEWTDKTCNVIGGCIHGCFWIMPDGTIVICYAHENAEHVAIRSYVHGFEHHYFRPLMLKDLSRGQNPLLIFSDSMSDLFANNVPVEHVRATLSAMRKAPHHSYQVLTKNAPRILKFIDDLPPNLWLGVSSPPDGMFKKRLSRQQQISMLRKSLKVLAEVQKRTGNIVWMSAEPISWDLTEVIDENHPLDWIVIGAASNGPKYYQPDADHVRKLLLVMDATKTPVFYKGNIAELFEKNDLGSDELNRWREDFPQTYRDGKPIPAVVRRQQNCDRYGWTRSRISLPIVAIE